MTERGANSETVVDVDLVRPDSKQPRKFFRESALKALARSIQLVGQRTPIEVKRLPPGGRHHYEIIDGERRWRAHQIAGIKTIRITIEEQELDERKQHLLSVISNFHREGHTHLEISDALHYQRERGETVAVLMENINKSEGWVYQYLKLQELVPELREKMHPETDERHMLRFAEAVVVAAVPAENQLALYLEGLSCPRGERLAFYRRRAAQLQKKDRIGRVARPKERMERFDSFVRSINQYLDGALELKDKEFDGMLACASTVEIRRMTERLAKVRDDIGSLLAIIERKLTLGKVA